MGLEPDGEGLANQAHRVSSPQKPGRARFTPSDSLLNPCPYSNLLPSSPSSLSGGPASFPTLSPLTYTQRSCIKTFVKHRRWLPLSVPTPSLSSHALQEVPDLRWSWLTWPQLFLVFSINDPHFLTWLQGPACTAGEHNSTKSQMARRPFRGRGSLFELWDHSYIPGTKLLGPYCECSTDL